MKHVKSWVTTVKQAMDGLDELGDLLKGGHNQRFGVFYSPIRYCMIFQQIGKVRAIVEHLPIKEHHV